MTATAFAFDRLERLPPRSVVEAMLVGERALRFVTITPASPLALFECLTSPRAVARWLPPEGAWVLEEPSIDARVGGAYRYLRTNHETARSVEVFGSFCWVEPGVGFEAIEIRGTRRGLEERRVTCRLARRGLATTLEVVVEWIDGSSRDLAMLAGAEVEAVDALERLGELARCLSPAPEAVHDTSRGASWRASRSPRKGRRRAA